MMVLPDPSKVLYKVFSKMVVRTVGNKEVWQYYRYLLASNQVRGIKQVFLNTSGTPKVAWPLKHQTTLHCYRPVPNKS